MKMNQSHLELLETAINEVLIQFPNARENYRNGNFPRSDKVKDLNKRFRWDLFYSAIRKCPSSMTTSSLYTYLNDNHIDTALRSIVEPL